MRGLIFTICLLGSIVSSASTCPNLTGRYKCEGGSWPGGYIQQIEQLQKGEYTQYVFTVFSISGYRGNSESYYTDGKYYDLGGVSSSSTCSKDTLITKYTMGLFSSRSDYSLDADKNLKISSRNILIPSWEVCKKIEN